MNTKDKIKDFQESVASKVDKVYQGLVFPDIFIDATTQEKNIRNQIDKTEYKKFDEDWIVKIESFFPSLNQIINNIRNTLKYDAEILPVERTRRTSNESTRHLLRNTKYIKDINEDDEVYPSKVLNTVSELDYGIYENRFIMTLIDRLYNYLLRRIDAINENIHGYKQTNFTLKNEFKIGEANYMINFELNAKEAFDSGEIDHHNRRIFERTNDAFKVVSRMYFSDFMRTMSRYKKIAPPILKTQMIQKNADFRNAYTLWLYLDKLNVLDFSLQLKEEHKTFNRTYLDQIDKSLMMLFSTIFINSDLGQSIFDQNNLVLESIAPSIPGTDTYAKKVNVKIPPIELESNLATEYHLDKAKQLFNKKELTGLSIDNNHENDVYLKQVLLDQYSIADQLFNTYLKLDQDTDVFDRLMTYKHPVKKYEEALDKYFITKAARQVKEKLFMDSVNLEERWLDELLYLQENAINTIINSGEKDDLTIISQMQKEVNKELKDLDRQTIKQTKKSIQTKRMSNNQRIKDLKEKYAFEVRAYRALQAKRMKTEKEKIAKKKLEETKKIRLRELQKRQKEKERLIKENQLKALKLKEKAAKTKLALKNKVSKELKNQKSK